MNTTALLGGVSTAMILGGTLGIIAALRVPSGDQPVRPPSRWAGVRSTSRAHYRLIILSLGVSAAVYVFTRWPVAAVATGAAVFALPKVMTGRAAAERIRKLEALELWTRRLADLLVAGRALEQALEHSAARNVPSAIGAPVAALARRLRVTRMATEEALRLFADELDDPIGDRIAAALILVARRRGKGASSVLQQLAELVAKDVSDRREVEAARAEHRTTVRWIIAILALFSTLAIFQKSYVAPYGTPLGQVVLAVVMVFYAATLAWLHQLGTAAPGHRFLNGTGRKP
ncbi:type II secretion system F family protein [Nonomuraea angiospora]|uniref:type II secretion system F family protein n=1 Tax=Nonomuraea angiospora TaxID=46172 RepID=UPI0029AF3082|nr:type II secretion system F family protein [Nonomuraea angiospora]MDX3099984.1 type II secretion system F family protein [Nonomuraea angiospora]